MLNMFTVKEQFYAKKQEIILKHKNNDNDFVKIYTYQTLSGLDLDNYLGILQIANLKKFNHDTINFEDSKIYLENFTQVCINLKELSRILNKKDGGQFRKGVLNTIQKMSSIYLEYQRIINKEGHSITGGTHLLSWYSKQDQLNNIQGITVGINPFAWYMMKKSRYNYCLINIQERSLLPTIQQRLLYFYLCKNVTPGLHYFCNFNMEELSVALWGQTSNSNTKKVRRHRVRKICEELESLQYNLTDFTIRLVKDNLTIQSIIVKREKVIISQHN